MIKIIYPGVNFLKRTLQRMMNVATLGVKGLVINSKNEVLLVQHTYVDGWHLPGGGVAKGETPKIAVIRELKEEAGIIVRSEPHFFAIYTNQIFGADDYPIVYVITDFELILNANLSFEINQAKWYSMDNLPLGTTPSTKLRIQEYREGLPPAEKW